MVVWHYIKLSFWSCSIILHLKIQTQFVRTPAALIRRHSSKILLATSRFPVWARSRAGSPNLLSCRSMLQVKSWPLIMMWIHDMANTIGRGPAAGLYLLVRKTLSLHLLISKYFFIYSVQASLIRMTDRQISDDEKL